MSEREQQQSVSGNGGLPRSLAEGSAGATVQTLLVLHFVFVLAHGPWTLATPMGAIRGPGPTVAALACLAWGGWRVAWRERGRLRPRSLGDGLRRRAPEIVVGGLVLVALGLRVWGSRFGEPLVLFPDEGLVAGYAIRMLKAGSLVAPEPFHYPTVFHYLMLPAFGLHFVRGMDRGLWSSLAEIERLEFSFYHLGRLHSAVLGAATVLLLYYVARRMWEGRDGRWAGVAAAALLTFSFVHVREGHRATTDVAMGFFVLVAFWSILALLDRADGRTYATAGFLCGIACATKYSAVPVVAVLVAAHLLARPPRAWPSGRILIGLAAVPVGFFVGYPSALLNWPAFLEHLGWLSSSSSTLTDVADRFRFVVGYSMESGMGPLFALTTLAAIVVYLHQRDRGAILAVVMMTASLVLLTRSEHRLFPRYLVPVLPFAALLAGRFTVDLGGVVARWLRERSSLRSPAVGALSSVASFALLAAAVAPQASESIALDRTRSLRETRALARDYIVARFSPGTRVLSEADFLTLPPGWTLLDRRRLGDLPLGFLEEQEVDIVVFSDRKRPPDPETRPARRRRRLRAALVPLEVVEAVPGESVGPTVQIFLRRSSLGEADARPGR